LHKNFSLIKAMDLSQSNFAYQRVAVRMLLWN